MIDTNDNTDFNLIKLNTSIKNIPIISDQIHYETLIGYKSAKFSYISYGISAYAGNESMNPISYNLSINDTHLTLNYSNFPQIKNISFSYFSFVLEPNCSVGCLSCTSPSIP